MAGQYDRSSGFFAQEDHQVAYVFHPQDGPTRPGRPAKRQKVSKQSLKKGAEPETSTAFIPLLNGAEKAASVRSREQSFAQGWGFVYDRIQKLLRESNSATLSQVEQFVGEAKVEITDKIPSAFIITGPDIAAQDLLFEQLSESLQQSLPSKFVRLRSADATTLKATLKKIIREATIKPDGLDEEEVQINQGGRRYLDYDLEALYTLIRQSDCEHVFVAFQDSEGFDSGLLSDLIRLFNSWRPRIPFTLLFGVATSVDLLQARLLKSVCQLIHGAQFDIVQSDTILESVFRSAVAARDVTLRIGAPLLKSLLDRQRGQIAGVQAFISSLKYAYMSHFYANPLSALATTGISSSLIQKEHIEAVRNTSSFRRHVERLVESSDSNNHSDAKLMIEDDSTMRNLILDGEQHHNWIDKLLRSLLILETSGAMRGSFSDAYITALSAGASAEEDSSLVSVLQQLEVSGMLEVIARILRVLDKGDETLHLGPGTDAEAIELRNAMEDQRQTLERLQAGATVRNVILRSKYSGHGQVTRTTVIAQRVRLSRDSAALSDEDKQFTEVIDQVAKLLVDYIRVPNASSILFSEVWLYESRSPLRDVMVPRPRVVYERSLMRPHDYLGCSCCAPSEGEGGLKATLPPTSILYQMYQETGNQINVADLWSAFSTLGSSDDGEGAQDGSDERKALAAFYQGLAELRALGFVKPSRKKMDHVAKVKWL